MIVVVRCGEGQDETDQEINPGYGAASQLPVNAICERGANFGLEIGPRPRLFRGTFGIRVRILKQLRLLQQPPRRWTERVMLDYNIYLLIQIVIGADSAGASTLYKNTFL